MKKKIIFSGALIGMAAIIFGAFGAHGLKKIVSPTYLQVFETAVRYQMYHALLLLFLAHYKELATKIKQYIFWCVVVGVVLFSGSLYVLVCSSIWQYKLAFIGILTPIGGLFLMVSWFLLAYGAFKEK